MAKNMPRKRGRETGKVKAPPKETERAAVINPGSCSIPQPQKRRQ